MPIEVVQDGDQSWGPEIRQVITAVNALEGTTTAGVNAALADKANASHAHIVTDVSGLQAALDGKAATSHTHASSGIPASTVDAKGDLIVGTGADAVARMEVGANGMALVADSTQATGLRYLGNTVVVATGDDSNLAAALASAPSQAVLVAVKVAGS